MKFKFDWTENISGSVEIDAVSGRHAEEMFKSMARAGLLQKSSELRSTGIDIDFIESRVTGIVTEQEWQRDWQLNDDEWEFWANVPHDLE